MTWCHVACVARPQCYPCTEDQDVLQLQGHTGYAPSCTAAVPRFLEAARSWGIDRDATVLLQKSPTLLQVRSVSVIQSLCKTAGAGCMKPSWGVAAEQCRALVPAARQLSATSMSTALQSRALVPAARQLSAASTSTTLLQTHRHNTSGSVASTQCADFGTHTARVAALRRLHPQLDVGRVLWGQPGILKVPPPQGRTLTGHVHNQAASCITFPIQNWSTPARQTIRFTQLQQVRLCTASPFVLDLL